MKLLLGLLEGNVNEGARQVEGAQREKEAAAADGEQKNENHT